MLATPESSRQSRLASMFTSELPTPLTSTVEAAASGGGAGGRLATLLAADSSTAHLNNLLGTDITGDIYHDF